MTEGPRLGDIVVSLTGKVGTGTSEKRGFDVIRNRSEKSCRERMVHENDCYCEKHTWAC